MLIRHCLVPLVLVLPLLTVFLPQLTCAGDKKTRERTVRMRQLLKVEESLCKRTMISTKSLREKMEMGDFLAKLPELLPKDKKATIEVDKKALGKEYAKFLKTPVEFPRFPDRMPFFTAFRFGLNQARKYDLDWKCSTGKITLTSPKNASFLVSYDLTTAMQLAPIWSADLRPPSLSESRTLPPLGECVQGGTARAHREDPCPNHSGEALDQRQRCGDEERKETGRSFLGGPTVSFYSEDLSGASDGESIDRSDELRNTHADRRRPCRLETTGRPCRADADRGV